MDKPSMPGAPRREYWCFLSYRHADNREPGREWATWLHHALETYEVPADLAGCVNERGQTIPAQIFPVFRDEEELAGGHLHDGIREALAASRALVVICSPRAVGSSYVNEEILTYKALRAEALRSGRRPVPAEPMAVIIDGDPLAPPGSASDCLPAALRFETDGEGRLTGQPAEESLWMDLRLPDGSQGWTSPGALREALEGTGGLSRAEIARKVEAYGESSAAARLRLIAGILGVPYGELRKRDQAYRLERARRRARVLAAVLGVVLVCAAAAVTAAGIAVAQRREAVRQRDIALARGEAIKRNSEWMNFELRDILATYAPSGVRARAAGKLDTLLQAVEAMPGLAAADEAPDAEVLRARMAADLQRAGVAAVHAETDPAHIRRLLDNALRLARELAGLAPDDAQARRDLAVAANKLGDLEARLGRLEEARTLYGEAMDASRRRAEAAPGDAQARHDLAVVLNKSGDLAMASGDPAAAADGYRAALAEAERAAEIEPGNSVHLRDIAASHTRIGDAEVAAGRLDAARGAHGRALAISRGLAAEHPDVPQYRRDAGVSLDKLGDLEMRAGNPAAARAFFAGGLELAREGAARDPDNIAHLRELGVSLNKCGSVALAGGDAPAAAAHHGEALELARRLRERDPQDILLRQDLATACLNLGNALMVAGRADEAGALFRESLVIRRDAAADAPDKPGLRRNLAVGHAVMAQFLDTTGETGRGEAAGHRREAAAILGQLAADGLLSPDDRALLDSLRAP